MQKACTEKTCGSAFNWSKLIPKRKCWGSLSGSGNIVLRLRWVAPVVALAKAVAPVLAPVAAFTKISGRKYGPIGGSCYQHLLSI